MAVQLSLLALTVLGASAQSVIFDQLAFAPVGWTVTDAAPLDHEIQLDIYVTTPHWDQLEQSILSASTPGHANYGKHLKLHEVDQMLTPSSGTLEKVDRWLTAAGISDIQVDQLRVTVRANVSQVEELLNAKYQQFEDEDRNVISRTLEYSVPAELEDHIEMIQPTTRFPRAKRPLKDYSNKKRAIVTRQPAVNFSDCNIFVTPTCLRQLYNVGEVHIDPKVKNTLAVNSFLNVYTQYDDQKQFQDQFAPWTKGRNFTWTSINGGKQTQNGAGTEEGNLDVQYAMAMGYPAEIHVFSTGGNGPTIPDIAIPPDSNEPWLDFLEYVVKLPDDKLPQTMTTSYGEDEQTLPRGYAQTVCKKLACLAARGVSFIIGSGDSGPGLGCQSNDGKNTTMFLPSFPSTCPWVTSVGGTTYSSRGFPHEVADYLSSGGFSNYFPRPAWQDKAVKTYLKALDGQWDGLYNKSGRGFPDVAAQSENYIVIGDGNIDADSGTSASSPAFAGIVALLNGARLTAGKPPLGFLNPWLYSHAHTALNDITKGKSQGCNKYAPPFIPHAGWYAKEGWDAVTGWGTPNFEKLLKLAMEV